MSDLPSTSRHNPTPCKTGIHDFFPPVVLQARSFFLNRRDVAVTVCRWCGKTTYIGWTETTYD